MIRIDTSPVSGWYDLIVAAQKESATALETDLEHYLINLLIRFTSRSDIQPTGLGIDFLQSVDAPYKMQEVGDQCLLLAGLFPNQAQRRNLSLTYFIGLGQQAYASVASAWSPRKNALLFSALSHQFIAVRDVLQATRAAGPQALGNDLLGALSLWQDIASPYAAHIIQRQGTVNTTPH